MAKTEFVNKVSRSIHKIGFQFKKHSPEILVVAGVIGTVASAVMACKATTKVSGIIDGAKETIDQIHNCLENPNMADKYTEEDSKKDLAIVYAQTGLQFVKLYGPSVALGIVSLGCILTSNNILRKRNVALAAAYATVDKGFKEYRNRVVERFGKELDKELRFGIKAKEIEEVIVNEKGEEEVVKKTVNVADDPNEYSDYARIFDCGCSGWTKDPELNLYYLKQQQNYANDRLKAEKYLFLNDVYKMLGFPATKAGQVVGWVYDEENPVGDNFVDFGIYNINSGKARDFVNGYERSIVLDFNVDGNIWELMH